jgi:hypothetical protein
MAVWLMRRATAWAVLAVFLSGLTVPALGSGHGQLEDDAFCAPFAQAGRHPTAQVEPVLPPVADDHCAVCHWLQAVGKAAPGSPSGGQTSVDTVTVGSSMPALVRGRTVLAEQPSRAPPGLA